tara:strand:+ start:339 stop:1355 length:1017 start_codon:yes stop_codon:yes gene_type:complete
MFQNYNQCTFCKSKKILKLKKENVKNNFYVDAILSDLRITKKQSSTIKVYECQNCKIKLNNPWFTKLTSRKIYSTIYGQHNRSWNNLIHFIEHKKLPNHGDLFKILRKNIKIKKYAEYNSPFMGLFLNFFYDEYNKNLSFYRNIHKNLIKYFNSRQLAGKSTLVKNIANKKSIRYSDNIYKTKKANLNKKLLDKYLFVDNTSLGWGQNDNFKSVNSKSYAQELFDLKLLEFDDENKRSKFDLFGIFHSLDHTFEPSKILNFALDSSKYVVVFCHNQNKGVSKQHQFSFTKNFLKFLNNNKVYNIDITKKINKSYESSELYFLCSKNKKNINLMNKKFK